MSFFSPDENSLQEAFNLGLTLSESIRICKRAPQRIAGGIGGASCKALSVFVYWDFLTT